MDAAICSHSRTPSTLSPDEAKKRQSALRNATVTSDEHGYFNMMTHAGDLDPRYVQRLRVDPALREIAELILKGDGDYNIRAAILDAVIVMVEEEGEGGDDDGW